MCPGAGFDVLGLRYSTSMPIRFISVATCSRPTVKLSWISRPRSMRLPAKGNSVRNRSIRFISFRSLSDTGRGL